jgi:Ca-activated chloride channel homolog
MHFANTEYFNYAWWLPVAAAIFWLYWQWRKAKLEQLADQSLLNSIIPGHNNRSFIRTGTIMLLGSVFIILALANPLGTSKPVKGKKTGVDIVIALDVSKSMDAQDLKPSRLIRATQFINNISSQFAGNRIGLVVFAGSAYVQMPLTTDASALKLFLDNVSTDMIAEQGTAIGDAIETSKELLFPNGIAKPSNTAKVILLLSDGENHDDEAIKSAKEAGRAGVIIYAIGVGSENGAPIPVTTQGILQGYLKDDNGETVISKLDPKMLNDIASEAHGSFYRLAEQSNLLSTFQSKLNSLSKGEQDFEIYDVKQTRFQWFAGIALFLLLSESILRNRLLIRKENAEIP